MSYQGTSISCSFPEENRVAIFRNFPYLCSLCTNVNSKLCSINDVKHTETFEFHIFIKMAIKSSTPLLLKVWNSNNVLDFISNTSPYAWSSNICNAAFKSTVPFRKSIDDDIHMNRIFWIVAALMMVIQSNNSNQYFGKSAMAKDYRIKYHSRFHNFSSSLNISRFKSLFFRHVSATMLILFHAIKFVSAPVQSCCRHEAINASSFYTYLSYNHAINIFLPKFPFRKAKKNNFGFKNRKYGIELVARLQIRVDAKNVLSS